jgi:hypothetical protein
MTNPVTSPLIPSLTGRQLTVDVALNTPTIIRNQIARLVDSQILLPKFFREYGAQIQAGAILWNSIQRSDFFIAGSLEQRTPGGEYAVVEGVTPDPNLALVEDWGGKFQIPEEALTRNNINLLDQQTIQLANEIVLKFDTRTVDTLQAANIGTFAAPNSWDDLVFVGPLDQITPSAARPTAHFAAAQAMADLEELGQTYDLLVVHPNQAEALRTAYAEDLDRMLKSAGFTEGMFVSARLPAGTVFVCQKGMVGFVGFERPLVVESWREAKTRSWWVQAYAGPAFAVDRPYAAKKITGVGA